MRTRICCAINSTLLTCHEQGQCDVCSSVFLMTAKNPSIAEVVPKATGSFFNQLLGMKGASVETVHLADCNYAWTVFWMGIDSGFGLPRAFSAYFLVVICSSEEIHLWISPSFSWCSRICDVA